MVGKRIILIIMVFEKINDAGRYNNNIIAYYSWPLLNYGLFEVVGNGQRQTPESTHSIFF